MNIVKMTIQRDVIAVMVLAAVMIIYYLDEHWVTCAQSARDLIGLSV